MKSTIPSRLKNAASPSSRTKIIDIGAGDPRILAALLAGPGRLGP
jgi:hypothetical protein